MALQGPDIAGLKAMARDCVTAHFVRLAEADGRPATLRAMDAVKKAAAQTVKAGGEDVDLAQEARDRGYSVEELADLVLIEAGKMWEIERARVRLSLAVDDCAKTSDVLALLDSHGVVFRENALMGL